MSLKNVTTEDLVSRWDMIIDQYLADVKKFRESLIKLEKVRNELSLIREELLSRNIDIDSEKKVEETKEVVNP